MLGKCLNGMKYGLLGKGLIRVRVQKKEGIEPSLSFADDVEELLFYSLDTFIYNIKFLSCLLE